MSENVSSQHDYENTVYYLLHNQFVQLIDHVKIIKMNTLSFTSKRSHICLEYVHFHIIFNAPLLKSVSEL
jgi:hypothetical protein